jgi:hypothetical protein
MTNKEPWVSEAIEQNFTDDNSTKQLLALSQKWI